MTLRQLGSIDTAEARGLIMQHVALLKRSCFLKKLTARFSRIYPTFQRTYWTYCEKQLLPFNGCAHNYLHQRMIFWFVRCVKGNASQNRIIGVQYVGMRRSDWAAFSHSNCGTGRPMWLYLTLNMNFTMCRPHVNLSAGYNQEVNLMTQPSLGSFVQCNSTKSPPTSL